MPLRIQFSPSSSGTRITINPPRSHHTLYHYRTHHHEINLFTFDMGQGWSHISPEGQTIILVVAFVVTLFIIVGFGFAACACISRSEKRNRNAQGVLPTYNKSSRTSTGLTDSSTNSSSTDSSASYTAPLRGVYSYPSPARGSLLRVQASRLPQQGDLAQRFRAEAYNPFSAAPSRNQSPSPRPSMVVPIPGAVKVIGTTPPGTDYSGDDEREEGALDEGVLSPTVSELERQWTSWPKARWLRLRAEARSGGV